MSDPMTAPNLPLTAEELERIERRAYYYEDDEEMALGSKAIKALIVQARTAIPDPNNLPLSTAMRMARERTEAGQETWVSLNQWDIPACLRYEAKVFAPNWQYADQVDSGRVLWLQAGQFSLDYVATATCRLVTPAEAEALLKGNADE